MANSIASKLRLAKEKGCLYKDGHRRSFLDYIMLDSYCAYYWSQFHWYFTFNEYQEMAKLLARYQRFGKYVREILPEWKTVKRIGYADNSVEEIQVDRFGNKRKRMIVGPGGDACY